MKEQLHEIIGKTNASHALVEAAHVYVYQKVTTEHLQSAAIGAVAVNAIASAGTHVEAMLFVDDYNIHEPVGPESYEHNKETYMTRIGEQGYLPSLFLWEKAVAQEAPQWLAAALEDKRIKQNKKGIFLPLGSQGVLWLAKADNLGMHYSCDALDALAYVKKSHLGADLLVTVLPEGYRSQQSKTRQVLSALGYSLPIVNIYFDPEQNIQVEFHYE